MAKTMVGGPGAVSPIVQQNARGVQTEPLGSSAPAEELKKPAAAEAPSAFGGAPLKLTATEEAARAAAPALPERQIWQLLIESAQGDGRLVEIANLPDDAAGKYKTLELNPGMSDNGFTVYLPTPGNEGQPVFASLAGFAGEELFRITPADAGNPRSYWRDQVTLARGDRRLIPAQMPPDLTRTHESVLLSDYQGESTTVWVPTNQDLSAGVFLLQDAGYGDSEVSRVLVAAAAAAPTKAEPPTSGRLGEISFDAPMLQPTLFERTRLAGNVYFRSSLDEPALRKQLRAGLQLELKAFDVATGTPVALDPAAATRLVASRDAESELGDLGMSFRFKWDDVPLTEGQANLRFELTVKRGDESVSLSTEAEHFSRPLSANPMGA